MAKQTGHKLNYLERHLPEGLVVDAAWLNRHGYSTSLRAQYVAAGWLEQPARSIYCRPRGSLGWQQIVVSLQMMLGKPLAVGGRTALELHGYTHYLSAQMREVHLYGPDAPPAWLAKLKLGLKFRYHNSRRLFDDATLVRDLTQADANDRKRGDNFSDGKNDHFAVLPWGQWEWPPRLIDTRARNPRTARRASQA